MNEQSLWELIPFWVWVIFGGGFLAIVYTAISFGKRHGFASFAATMLIGGVCLTILWRFSEPMEIPENLQKEQIFPFLKPAPQPADTRSDQQIQESITGNWKLMPAGISFRIGENADASLWVRFGEQISKPLIRTSKYSWKTISPEDVWKFELKENELIVISEYQNAQLKYQAIRPETQNQP
mgnify:CR=1 FL=1